MESEIVLVIYNSSIEEEVLEALDKAGMHHYTKFVNIQGVGECSDPRLNSHVWPGTNSMLLVCLPAGERECLLEAVRALKDNHREEGVTAFVLPVISQV
jgi:hypothetical protein